MRNDLIVTEKLFKLEVPDGLQDEEVASEVSPCRIGRHMQTLERWSNGPTQYHRYRLSEYWLIRWNGKYSVIKTECEAGDWPDDRARGWEVVATLPVPVPELEVTPIDM